MNAQALSYAKKLRKVLSDARHDLPHIKPLHVRAAIRLRFGELEDVIVAIEADALDAASAEDLPPFPNDQ